MLEEKRQWTDQISGLERRCASVNDENRRLKEENERLRDELQFLRSEVRRVLLGWLQRGHVHDDRSSCMTLLRCLLLLVAQLKERNVMARREQDDDDEERQQEAAAGLKRLKPDPDGTASSRETDTGA